MTIQSIIRALTAVTTIATMSLAPLAASQAAGSVRTVAYEGAPTIVMATVNPGHSLCGDRLGHTPTARTLHACRTRSMNEMRAQIAALGAIPTVQ